MAEPLILLSELVPVVLYESLMLHPRKRYSMIARIDKKQYKHINLFKQSRIRNCLAWMFRYKYFVTNSSRQRIYVGYLSRRIPEYLMVSLFKPICAALNAMFGL